MLMGSKENQAFASGVLTGLIVGFVLGLALMATALSKATTVVSEAPIEHEIKLVIKDNKVDTLYVYKKSE